MGLHFLAALALTCAAFGALAQQALEVISLRYRTADQVLATLRPLVEPGGTLTGQGNQLILRVSAANLAEIRRALDAIDRPQRRLQISVRFDDAFDASRRELGASGTISNQGSRIELRGQDSRASTAERVDQRVLAMDGGRATVFAGEAASGFDVMPRVSGDAVLLDIYAARGVVEASSTVSGRLGEWLELGAVNSRRVQVKVEVLD